MRHPVQSGRCDARQRGFTLIELCIVLFIMALLAGAAMPAMQSAFTEQALRCDEHELSMMVKTAMIKSGEQQRPYLLCYDGKNLSMGPASAVTVDEKALIDDTSEDAAMTEALGNTLEFPDAVKKDSWETLPSVKWTFEPGGLCPLPRVRLQHGVAYLEMSFNALTGDVENEAFYLP